jgi:dihydrofolate reductase
MRTVTYGGASSLDGYIARTDGGVDWLLWSADVEAIMAGFWPTIDTVVMGRKTWEVAAGASKSDGGYPGMASYVCSRSMKAAPAGVTIASDGVALVRQLKMEPGKDICLLGGGDLARSLFEAGLIDRVGLNVHPILLGSGVPVFRAMSRDVRLALEEARPLEHGCVYVTYRVTHGS